MNGQNFPLSIHALVKDDQRFIKRWAKQTAREAMEAEAAAAAEPKGNWDAPWPRLISAPVSQAIEIVKEDKEKNEFIYTSPNYEFRCNVKLNTSVVKRFALLFEATNLFCRELPLGMEKPYQEKRFLIELTETKEQYHQKGGPQGSAGVYFGGRDTILVPLTSLGVVKRGSSYSVDYKAENGTLSHEICHQLTDGAYYQAGSRGWFTEGLAEYIANSGYRSGKFNVNDLIALKASVVGYGEKNTGGMGLGNVINVPKFKDFAMQPYSRFTGSNARVNYGVSALFVYYFFHMDGKRDAANIKAFLKEIKGGKKPQDAFPALLAGRTFEELEKDISNSWKSKSIRINFK